jgi:hypothetical protein
MTAALLNACQERSAKSVQNFGGREKNEPKYQSSMEFDELFSGTRNISMNSMKA